MQKILTSLFLLLISISTYPQTIKNVHAERDGDGIVVDYTYTGSSRVRLYLWVSLDGGVVWKGPLRSVRGNVGDTILIGENKMIWNVTEDFDVFFGDSIIFRVASGTQNTDQLFDPRDGKIYKTATIGNTIWMAENLDFATASGSSYYGNSELLNKKYGRLYNWATAIRACPSGWHLPSNSDWLALVEKSGGKKGAGINLKSETDWISSKSPGFNTSNFCALPGGYTKYGEQYKDKGTKGLWWTSDDVSIAGSSYSNTDAICYDMESASAKVSSNSENKISGLSVRCISDPIFYAQSVPAFYAIVKPDCDITKIPFEAFALNYIEEKILLWQKQGSNEKRSDYLFRVIEEKRKVKQQELAREAENIYMNEISKLINWHELEIGLYNSGKETVQLKSDLIGDFEMPVPINDIISFKQNWKKLSFTDACFFLDGESMMLTRLTISNPTNGMSYKYDSPYRIENDQLTTLNRYFSFDLSKEVIIEESNLSSDNIIPFQNKDSTVSNQLAEIPQYRQAQTNVSPPKIKPQSDFGKFYALLIAVNSYEDNSIMDLDEPVKDACELHHILTTNYTFDSENVYQLINPRREEILISLEKLIEIITPDDNLLIFYAGHGKWDEKMKTGYWLPADASRASTANWFRNSTLQEYVAGIDTKHTLVIADACFSGAIFKSRSLQDQSSDVNESTAAKLYKLPSRNAMTSGTLETVPDRSVFMFYLTKRLIENDSKYLTSEELFSTLRNAVLNNSPNTPQYGDIMNAGDEGGDFIFIRRD